MIRSVEKVRERLLRAAGALEAAGISYAVAGGNAVAAWVSRVDEEAVRNTRDIDILVRRSDLPAIQQALGAAGFVYQQVNGIDLFLDGPDGKPSSGVHLVFAGESIRPNDIELSPEVDQSHPSPTFRVVDLEALVTMKLTAYRRKDQVHLLDLLAVGLIDEAWPARLPPELGQRLQSLLDDPDG
jgi:hypothetical protein